MADISLERGLNMQTQSKLPILGFILLQVCLLSFFFLDVLGSISH